MKAIVADAYGPTEVLELRDVDIPTPGDGQVLIRVVAAGVHAGDWHLMAGLPYVARLAVGLRAPKNPPGMEVAGTVEAVGPNVTNFAPGDEVCGIGVGAFAEYCLAPINKLVHKPTRLTFQQAAALPISGITALQGLRDSGHVAAGQHVLVIGAAGGVGTFAVQLAKSFGATVTGVCSTSKMDLVRSLGADDVIDYTRADIADHSYDVILDCAGHRSLSALRRAATERGTIVIVGSETNGRLLGGTDRALRALLLSPFVRQTLRGLISGERLEDLETLRDLAEQGVITPVIDRTFPLVDVPQAIDYQHAGKARGKVVITVS
ncbi:NAD(P)-dependent alcohol dehydrogenase [Antrihabitans stalactiti]|uniref:NAD(P)-dependent alcohol dehydrogenase n=1 Tax=Antrihabitans stalactiti TaxID=2584121 RepID=A0A848KJE8_9NOCA|nr:NAD(P)-dependent alcohol dehydrogenase [Antrihabitans stalactiti]NMN98825.1 NAD(P)-dependent alcohol dehydrogenase [Antrihabitans stalactiti]